MSRVRWSLVSWCRRSLAQAVSAHAVRRARQRLCVLEVREAPGHLSRMQPGAGQAALRYAQDAAGEDTAVMNEVRVRSADCRPGRCATCGHEMADHRRFDSEDLTQDVGRCGAYSFDGGCSCPAFVAHADNATRGQCDMSNLALFRRVEALIERVDTPYLRYPVRWRVGLRHLGATVVMFVDVLDRDTGEPRTLRSAVSIGPELESADDVELLRRTAFALLERFMKHEAAECFRFHGRRIFEAEAEGLHQ